MHLYQSNRKQTSQQNGSAQLAYSLIRKIVLQLLQENVTSEILDFVHQIQIFLFRIFGYQLQLNILLRNNGYQLQFTVLLRKRGYQMQLILIQRKLRCYLQLSILVTTLGYQLQLNILIRKHRYQLHSTVLVRNLLDKSVCLFRCG